MIRVKVVDASAVGAFLFDEPEAKDIIQQFKEGWLVAPDLLSSELASICLKKIRRFPDRTDEWVSAFAFRASLTIDERPVDPDAMFALAKATGLTAYDACYLWLARHLSAELVTLDKQLARAAV